MLSNKAILKAHAFNIANEVQTPTRPISRLPHHDFRISRAFRRILSFARPKEKKEIIL